MCDAGASAGDDVECDVAGRSVLGKMKMKKNRAVTTPAERSSAKKARGTAELTCEQRLERRRALLVKVLWTAADVAELTELHPQTIYKAIADGQLTSGWICGKVFVPRDAIVRKFETDFPALMRELDTELGPMARELRSTLEDNRAAMLKLCWSAGELAKLTGLHPQTIYKSVETEEIASRRIGSKILILREPFVKKFQIDVQLLLESLRIAPQQAA